jgi:nucleotide-binding universal stress UspA family protein
VLAIRRILHPTDFSDLSARAFELACSLARDYRAELTVLHVAPPPVCAVADGMMIELPTGWEAETRARLTQVRPTSPGLTITHRLESGDAGREIVRVADEEEVDLIVIGTHGRGGVGRVLLGSVAEAVLRKAPCPVLTVKSPAPVRPEPAAAATQPAGRA